MENISRVLLMVIFTVALLGCGQSDEEIAALDSNPVPVSSCSIDGMKDVAISSISWTDTARVCSAMTSKIGAHPSIRSLRLLLKSIDDMNVQGGDNILSTAFQFMNVVDERNQLSNDALMMDTINLTFKIYNGTGGRVTPSDVSVLLYNMGDNAKHLSDDGIVNLASVLSVQRGG